MWQCANEMPPLKTLGNYETGCYYSKPAVVLVLGPPPALTLKLD